MKRMRKKRRVFLILLIIFILLILCISESFILFNSSDKKLKKLKFRDDTIEVINDLNIKKKILKKNKYSKTLEVALLTSNFDEKNIDQYYYFEYKNDDRFIKHLNYLIDLGYNNLEITEIFDSLSFDDIDKLIMHEYISNISDYIKYTYFNIDNIDRYISYREKTQYDIERCITYVNIGLDKEYYTDYKTVNNPDNILVLVNKYSFLPSDYEPKDLVTLGNNYSLTNVKMRSVAASSFEELSSDASAIGLSILGMSGYRSYSYQENLYNRYKKNDPKNVDTYSARPGASEHQTGLALDVATKTTTYTDFGKTKEYEWLKINAHKYGFIIRYTKDNTNITGYKQEEWHIRYVGEEVAKYIYENNITYDEYYIRFLENK